jgi:polynucleotide 5'-kinase involved in rRNA processing
VRSKDIGHHRQVNNFFAYISQKTIYLVVVVDTGGWIAGQGYAQLLEMTQLFQATHCVALADSDLFSRLWHDINGRNGIQVLFNAEERPRTQLHSLSTVERRERRFAWVANYRERHCQHEITLDIEDLTWYRVLVVDRDVVRELDLRNRTLRSVGVEVGRSIWVREINVASRGDDERNHRTSGLAFL